MDTLCHIVRFNVLCFLRAALPVLAKGWPWVSREGRTIEGAGSAVLQAHGSDFGGQFVNNILLRISPPNSGGQFQESRSLEFHLIPDGYPL